MYGSLEDLPLRQIKFVKTRTSVLKTTTNLLKEKDFEQITIDEICQKSQISRGTFFNYFPQKSFIFYYYLRIFTIKIAKRMENWDENISFRKQLEGIYTWFDEESQYPNFVSSYIHYLLENESGNDMKLTAAEFVYFFTGIEDEEAYLYYNNLTIEGIVRDLCKKAKVKGELSGQIEDEKVGKIFLALLVAPFITNNALETHTDPGELLRIILDRVLAQA